jgi:hypothetical protein
MDVAAPGTVHIGTVGWAVASMIGALISSGAAVAMYTRLALFEDDLDRRIERYEKARNETAEKGPIH